MSVTVGDIMMLPSLREAKVLGGKGGLQKIVSSISVLESTDPSVLEDDIFPNSEFYGSEIVITGFLNCCEDVDTQYANMKRLAEGGEVGLILFYVGLFMPKVDKRLIELANQKDFVLICMPKKRMDLRYSEVITEVMESIVKDKMNKSSIVTEVLEQITKLSPKQRTVNTGLKMISDRTESSLVLTDAAGNFLNLIAWPRSLDSTLKSGMEKYGLPETHDRPVRCPFLKNCMCCLSDIENGQAHLNLLIYKEGIPLDAVVVQQIREAVHLLINIWGERHGEIAIHELVCAIMADEPIKMRRLADIFHIDVASIHEMWLVKLRGKQGAVTENEIKKAVSVISGLVRGICVSSVVDIYQNDIVVFTDGVRSMKDADALSLDILNISALKKADPVIIRGANLQTTTDVREAYNICQACIFDAEKVFHGRNYYHMEEIDFVYGCRRETEAGEEAVKNSMKILSALTSSRENDELIRTLEIFLLDADSGITKAAEMLFVHVNTVKYRLQRAADLLGFRPEKTPDNLALYKALVIRRLLK